MKRTHLKWIVIAILLVLPFAFVSCSNSENGMLTSTAVSSVVIVTPTTTPTQTPTSIPTITPTPTPTPTPIPTLTHSAEDDLAMAPEIAGLNKKIQIQVDGSKKVTYIAFEGNEYGLKEGEFAGIYISYIFLEGKQVGGVALETGVVDKILSEQLAKIPEGEKNMKVVIPLDITEVNQETEFNIEDTIEPGLSEYLGKESHIMIVELNKPLTFINPCIENNQFNTIDGFTSDSSYIKENGEILTISIDNHDGLTPLSCFDQPGTTEKDIGDIYYEFVCFDKNEMKSFDEEKTYIVGEKTNIKVKSYMSIWFDYEGLKGTTPDDLLTLSDGTVVFTYPQASVGTEATSNPTN